MWLSLWMGCTGPAPFGPPQAQLTIEQLRLSGPSIGEAALLFTAQGDSVLVDVGNDGHTRQVLEALDHHLGERVVDHVLLTHFHADHIGGFEDLVEQGLRVREGVWHRGFHGLDDANTSELEPIQEVLSRSEWAGLDRPLCDADGCAGLGELQLGSATLTLAAADGRVLGAEAQASVQSDENARSVVGVVELGDFAWAFGGDLTGGGKDTPDVEAFVASRLPAELVPDGVDVLQLNHHGIDSSSHDAWLDRLLPADGGDHNAVVGANGGYLSAPDEAVLGRVGPRLGQGSVWVTAPGSRADAHERRRDADAGVVVRVVEWGARYAISAREGDEEVDGAWFEAN